MEEESREAVSGPCIDNNASIPPTEAWRSYEKRVYFTNWNGESIGADRVGISSRGDGGGNESCLPRRR